MAPISRRVALKGVAASSISLSTLGCDTRNTPDRAGAADGGQPGKSPEVLANEPAAPQPAAPTRPVGSASRVKPPQSRYRSNQELLFQPIARHLRKSRIPNGTDLDLERFGPNHEYVDFNVGWSWDRPGGDWLDARRARHGSVPWFKVSATAATGSTAVAPYRLDVTGALQFVQAKQRWCAFLLRGQGAPRVIAGTHHASHHAPYIDVKYANGSTARLTCRITAAGAAGSTRPTTAAPDITLPAFIEFDRPTSQVASAAMGFVVTQHWDGATASIEGFLVDPPINSDPVQQGLAASAGKLDEGLASNPSILGVHRYVDGVQRDAFVHDERIDTNSEREFDPAIWGDVPADLRKLPHKGLGKWIGASEGWTIVDSNHRGDGFQALAPGLGAMRIAMPAARGIRDGSVVGYSGSLGGHAFIFMPEPLFGRLGHIFVRHYFRIGTPDGSPYHARGEDRLQIYHDEQRTSAAWTDSAGKFGIMPEHLTSYGGVSGTSGGGAGWQMRLAWADCDAWTGNGPDEGGWSAGCHLFDFQSRNPAGHNYANDPPKAVMLGQRGGLGGILYANQWYCIESELRLNSVMDGWPGFRPDGELRVWIDGRLAFERTGMVFRALPLIGEGYKRNAIRPCRELGVRGLWLNWFHGGTTPNVIDRTVFVTGLAWGQKYIGPMSQ